MAVVTRIPKWKVQIKRPDYTSPSLSFLQVPEWGRAGNQRPRYVEFVSSKTDVGPNGYTDLIGYEFNNNLRDPEGGFSLTFVPAQDGNRLTWKDKIKIRDMVFIYEFGILSYIGIIKSTSYSSSMNGESPTRRISMQGHSLGGAVKAFNLPMNIYLWFNIGTTADTANDALTDALNSDVSVGQNLKNTLRLITERFFRVAFGGNLSGFTALINEYISLASSDLEAYYPMNIRPFNDQVNNLFTIFKNILPEPVYEVFGVYENGVYKIKSREAPFDYDDWNNLPLTEIDPVELVSQTFGDSDTEVYTQYFSDVPNSVITENQAYADSEFNGMYYFDEEKFPIYGHRQLRASFPYYNLDGDAENRQKLIDFCRRNSARLYAWYNHNDEFQSGSITLMTRPRNDGKKFIQIGERIQYMNGNSGPVQFYVEGEKRSMQYPERMTSEYVVTRGFEYGRRELTVNGVSLVTPLVSKISNIAKRLIQSERNETPGVNRGIS
jgi:hypothetical protein